MYSDAELQKSNLAATEKSMDKSTSAIDYGQATLVSAESVALSLIKQFSEKQLPKASDLEWLVSEQDAPQAVSNSRYPGLLWRFYFNSYLKFLGSHNVTILKSVEIST